MIRIVTGCDAEIGQWIGERLGSYLGAGAALGFAENGKLLAGIHYTLLGRPWASCEMTIYAGSSRWATRRSLQAAFSYPFLQAGSKRCGATIAIQNRHAREFVERLGFRQEGIGREAWLSGDVAIYGMLRAECRWLRGQGLSADLIDVVCPPLLPASELAVEPAKAA
jgi:RimJ/RimL family protein N-acetyltransferase